MRNRSFRHWILAVDLLWMSVALMLALGWRYASLYDAIVSPSRLSSYSMMVVAALITWILLYFEMALDGFKGGWNLPAILSKTIVAVSLMMTVVFAVAFLTQHNYSRLVLLYFALLFTAGVVSTRCLSRSVVVAFLRNTGDNRCLILGNGPVARELASKIESHPELAFRLVGFLSPSESEALNLPSASMGKPGAPITSLQVLELLAQHRVRKVIIAMEQPTGIELRKLISECRKASVQVYLVPQLYDLYLSRAALTEIDSLPLLSLEEHTPVETNLVVKRALDVALSFGMLLLASPLIAISALVVRVRRKKAIRSEVRCGKGGIPFRMYRLNVERHAPSPEPYERFLVRWSLTELPQLWNVLRGEMSLVGPRPEPPEKVKYYSEWQAQRLKVPAGVTGLAQVHGLREQHSSEDKARFDLQYIFTCSPLLDLGLVVQSVWTLLSRGLSHEPFPFSSVTDPARTAPNDFLTQEVIDANRS